MRIESLKSYRREGESPAETRERLRAVVSKADDAAFAAQLRKTKDGSVILAMAVDVFGSKASARTWLAKPAIGLGNYSAQELATNPEGRQAVIAYLADSKPVSTHD